MGALWIVLEEVMGKMRIPNLVRTHSYTGVVGDYSSHDNNVSEKVMCGCGNSKV